MTLIVGQAMAHESMSPEYYQQVVEELGLD
jgi:hypothetical protein